MLSDQGFIEKNDAIVISDIHLGSDVCCVKELLTFLATIETGEIDTSHLILNGDVFDSHDFRRLKKSHWKVLSVLRKLSDRIDIVWIAGNHDGPAAMISQLIGVNVVEEYQLYSSGNKIVFLHGHVYDEFVENYPLITWAADSVYYLLQKIDRSHDLCRWAKQQSKTYLRCSQKIETMAVAYARKQGAAAVCVGHSHNPCANSHGDVFYYNSGSWTERPCSYLAVTDGSVSLHYWQKSATARTKDLTSEA